MNAIDILGCRLILALLTDDRAERDWRIEEVRKESGLDRMRFSLAMAVAIEAVNWWSADPGYRQYARDVLSDRIMELTGAWPIFA